MKTPKCSNCSKLQKQLSSLQSEIQHKLTDFFDYVMKSYHQTFADQNKALLSKEQEIKDLQKVIKKLEKKQQD